MLLSMRRRNFQNMVRIIDIECNPPTSEMLRSEGSSQVKAVAGSGDTFRGKVAESVSGHGMANYLNIFGPGQATRAGLSVEQFEEMRRTMSVEDLQLELQRLNERPMSLDEFVLLLSDVSGEHAVIGTTTGPGNHYHRGRRKSAP
jgi:hypothetical protein